MDNNVSWFYESASERARHGGDDSTSVNFGAYQKEGTTSFDEHFQDLYNQYKEQTGIDIKKDFNAMISDKQFMEQYKQDLMGPTFEAFREASGNDPHIEQSIKTINTLWDTKIKNYTESASMTGFLPIATLEFPVLLKQYWTSIMKDIIDVEATKTPNISKHIRTTYMVDNQTGEEY